MKNDKTMLSIESYGMKYTVEISDDSSIDLAVKSIYGLLLAIGYGRESIEQYIKYPEK